MKKLYFLSILYFILFIALPAFGKPMFVYRNDGVINILETSEIDSIRYSRLDMDFTPKDEFVVQEILTKDSLYRIPLNVIDSIGFHIPKTVYKPDVIAIGERLRNYIKSVNELNIYLDSSTPSDLLPKKGDKLVTMNLDDIIIRPFIGKVSSVNHGFEEIEVVCDPVELTDIFEVYYFLQYPDEPLLSHKRNIEVSNNGYASLNQYQSFNLLNSEDPDWAIGFEPNDNFSINTPTLGATLNVAGETTYNTSLIIHPAYGVNLSIDMTGTYTTKEILSISGSLTLKGEKTMLRKIVAVPRALVEFYFEIGGFADFTGDVNINGNLSQLYRHKLKFDWSSRRKEYSIQHSLTPYGNTKDGELTLNGDLKTGIIVKTGMAFIFTSSLDISEIGVEAKAGVDLEGNAVIFKPDTVNAMKSTDLYNKLKNASIDISFFYGASFAAKLFKWSYNKELPDIFNIPLNKDWKAYSLRLVPEFKESSIRKYGNTYSFETHAQGNVFKSWLGVAVINAENDEDVNYDYINWSYEGPKKNLYYSFTKSSSSASYNVYPLIKCFGVEMIAEPFENTEKITPYIQLNCKEIKYNSAEFSATFKDVPDGAICLVYLQWEENGVTKMVTKKTTPGEDKKVKFWNLKPSTKYICTAAVRCEDREYYSSEYIFTTNREPITGGIDLSGVWLFYAEGFDSEPWEIELSLRKSHSGYDEYGGSHVHHDYWDFLYYFTVLAFEDGRVEIVCHPADALGSYSFDGNFNETFSEAGGSEWTSTNGKLVKKPWKIYRK